MFSVHELERAWLLNEFNELATNFSHSAFQPQSSNSNKPQKFQLAESQKKGNKARIQRREIRWLQFV